MPQIFISYSHQDKAKTRNLVESLRKVEADNQVWFDEHLKAGQKWSDKLVDKIIKSDVFIFLVSPDSVKSEYCKQEIAQAQGARKPIIPLMIKQTPITDFPSGLSSIQYQDVSAGISTWRIEHLQRSIEAIVQEETAKSALVIPPPTNTVNVDKGDYIHSSGPGPINVTKNYFQTSRLILFLLFILVIIVAVLVFLNRPKATPPEPKVAYEFLVDTSNSMETQIHGVSRYKIITDAIRLIANIPGLDGSHIYRSLRIAGGGYQCNQTTLVAQGRGDQQSLDQFVAPLEGIKPEGNNSVEEGIRASFKDLDVDEIRESDVKVVFILLGSLDLNPCRNFDIPTALSAYKQLGISTVFCAFTLSDDAPGFERFQRQMLDRGFECVHNVETPEEISKIAVSVIEKLVLQFKGLEVQLTPIETSTQVIYLQSTDTPTQAFTDTATKTPIPTLTASYTLQPTVDSTVVTNIPSQTPTLTPSLTPTVEPSITPTHTEQPTEKPTIEPSTKPSYTPTRTPSATDTLEPSASPTLQPSKTPTPITPTTTLNPTLITYTPTSTFTITPSLTPTLTVTYTPSLPPNAQQAAQTATAKASITPTMAPTLYAPHDDDVITLSQSVMFYPSTDGNSFRLPSSSGVELPANTVVKVISSQSTPIDGLVYSYVTLQSNVDGITSETGWVALAPAAQAIVIAHIQGGVTIRKGPSQLYERVGIGLKDGERAIVLGQATNHGQRWYYVDPENPQSASGWLWSGVKGLELQGNISNVPQRGYPPEPTLTPTPVPTPTP